MRRLAGLFVSMLLAIPAADGPSALPPPAAGAPAPSAPPTTCGAEALAWLVGQPKEQIPVPIDPARRRVSCTACPPPTDHRPDRTDILFDANTGIVTAVTCG